MKELTEEILGAFKSYQMNKKWDITMIVSHKLLTLVAAHYNISNALLINDVDLLEKVLNKVSHDIGIHFTLEGITLPMGGFKIKYQAAKMGQKINTTEVDERLLDAFNL